jgi:hydroxymethylglutaryl-CoA lyase
MSETIRIYEVGPRDGLQNEAAHLTTGEKLALIAALAEAGITTIEVTSFVHPNAVPQMADADRVMIGALEQFGARANLVGLVLNEKGYDRALAADCRRMACGVAVSETFSQRNTRMSTAEAFAMCQRLAERARADGVWFRAYLMTAWVCPFEGRMASQKAVAYAQRLWDMGVEELAISDTIGHADPLSVGRLLEQIGKRTDMDRLAVHLHDTQVLGLANATTALSAGVRTFDSSVGGLGGCPFAPGAAGNLATEDLVFLAYKLGMGTGIDFAALWKAVALAEKLVKRPIGGRIRSWWEAHAPDEPQFSML